MPTMFSAPNDYKWFCGQPKNEKPSQVKPAPTITFGERIYQDPTRYTEAQFFELRQSICDFLDKWSIYLSSFEIKLGYGPVFEGSVFVEAKEVCYVHLISMYGHPTKFPIELFGGFEAWDSLIKKEISNMVERFNIPYKPR